VKLVDSGLLDEQRVADARGALERAVREEQRQTAHDPENRV
jgi:hypothetical protein